MAFETDKWPWIGSRYFGDTNTRTVRLIVIHDMEAPEAGTTAEAVARYFASGQVKASAHLCIDNNSIVQCVKDGDVAYAAPGANNDGIQLELAGYARQTREQWLDTYSKAVLENAAKATAQYCLKFGIPAVRLTNAELSAGKKGVIGHVQASQVYKKSSHSDPGGNFPWGYFMQRVAYWMPYYKNGRVWPSKVVSPTVVKAPVVGEKIPGDTVRWLGLTNPRMQGQDVKNAQNVLLMAGNPDIKPEAEDAIYGELTAAKIAVFQENRGIVERGVGPKTWAALRDYVHG